MFPLCILSFFVVSCIDSNAVYTLNPDGAGKVLHTVKLTKSMGNWTSDTPDKDLAMNMVRGAEGIDAWDDIQYRMADGGNAIEFKGTAYFPKISEVNLGRAISADGDEHSIPVPRLEWKPDDSGKGKLTIRDAKAVPNSAKMKITVNGKEVNQKKDKDEKDDEKSGKMWSMMAMKMALDSAYRVEIKVNGSLANGQGFSISESGKSAVFTQDRIEKSRDKAAAEKKKDGDSEVEKAGGYEEMLKQGVFENKELQQIAFDREAPFTIHIAAEKPSFEYGKESASAEIQNTDEKIRKKLDGWKKLNRDSF